MKGVRELSDISKTPNQYFSDNINNYLVFSNLKSISDLSIILKIKKPTLESWFYKTRTPKLSSIDRVANAFNVDSCDLIGKQIDFSKVVNNQQIFNQSQKEFPINLRKYLNKYDISTAKEFESFFEHSFSKHLYYSYFKKNNKKMPTLNTIITMASYFYIRPNQLIERNDI